MSPIYIGAQVQLSKQEAVEIALENNYDIKVVNNNVEASKNNANVYNSGYLPSLTANGGAGYRDSSNENEFENGTIQTNNSISKNYNASVGVNYLLFDYGHIYVF